MAHGHPMIVVKKFSTVMGSEAPLANRRNDRFAQRGAVRRTCDEARLAPAE
jgi:hypothetical protein